MGDAAAGVLGADMYGSSPVPRNPPLQHPTPERRHPLIRRLARRFERHVDVSVRPQKQRHLRQGRAGKLLINAQAIAASTPKSRVVKIARYSNLRSILSRAPSSRSTIQIAATTF